MMWNRGVIFAEETNVTNHDNECLAFTTSNRKLARPYGAKETKTDKGTNNLLGTSNRLI